MIGLIKYVRLPFCFQLGKAKANFLRHEGYLGAIGAFLKGCEAESADIEVLKSFENLENCSWTENLYGSTPSFQDPLIASGAWQAGSLSSYTEGCRKRCKSASMAGKISDINVYVQNYHSILSVLFNT